jgi:putative salt-induced outer membrane protein
MVEVLTAVAASHDARALDSLVQYLQQTHPEAQAAIAEWVARRNRAVWLAALDSRLSSRLKARLSYTLQHEAGSGVARTLTDTTSRLTLLYGF